MKPFNLQEALAGKPVVTRDGRKVQRVVHVPEAAGEYNLLAVINGQVVWCLETGRQYKAVDSACDLFMAPEKVTKWLNIFRPVHQELDVNRCKCATPGLYLYETEEAAKARAQDSKNYITTVPITFEV